MGVNAEGKISLSVELQNFKDIAGSLKKGLSEELKQVPLDVQFNNKDLEKKASAALHDINEMFSKTRLKNLDFSSILPAFINEINRGDISDEIRYQVIEGFRTGLNNLKIVGATTQNYSKIKGFDNENLLKYFSDINDVEDILDSFKGLSKRQKQGLRTSVLPSLSELKGRGWDTADKEYTKGAKRLDAILQLTGQYGDVIQYGTNPTATKNIIKELDKRFKEGNASKIDAEDLIGYLLRSDFLNIDLKGLDIDSAGLLKEAKNILGDKADEIENALKKRTQLYFKAYDEIFNSSAAKVDFSDISKGLTNTTNKKLQSVYNAEVPENKKIKVGKLFKETVKIKSDEKPELRKRDKINNDKETTKQNKNQSKDELKDEIQDYEKKINEITNELKKISDEMFEISDRKKQLLTDIEELQTSYDKKEEAYSTYKNNYDKYVSSVKNAKFEADALKGTIASLDKQLEEEEKNKQQIEKKYNELIAKRELIKNEIAEKEQTLDKILPVMEEKETNFDNQINELNNKKEEKKEETEKKKKVIKNYDEWLKWYDEALKAEYEFNGSKSKSEAYEALQRLGKQYSEFRKNPDSSLSTDKQAEEARFAIKHYRMWHAAKEVGVADSRLEKERFDTDDDLAYKQAIEYLQQERNKTKEIRDQIQNELEKTKEEIVKIQNEIKQTENEKKNLQSERKKILGELRRNPAEREEENERKIKRVEGEFAPQNAKIEKIKEQKEKTENRLKDINNYLEENELTPEREKGYKNRLQQLEKERDAQNEILTQKKKSLEKEIAREEELSNLGKELIAKQDALIQRKKESEKKQKELDKQEEKRKKQAEADKKKADSNKADSDTEETQSSKGSETTENTGTSTSIPPEKLQEILTLLGNIQKVLGTLEDGSDIPSITQSVKSMADALKELSDALGEIKQKDFNLNIGLPSNNPIGQQGEAKRKILKELAQQYDELNSYFVNKYGDDSSAFNALSKLNGGSNYVNTMMSDYSIIGDTNASLSDKIEVYKTLIEQLRSFLIQEGGDINNVLTNVLSPEEIINKITNDIAKFNPTTALQSIFEEMKISIDASLAQINTESKGFSFLSGSAEEAAEAKRKFVEANKDVLQSIVASMPKIEQEAESLQKINDTSISSNTNQNITEGINDQSLEIEEAYLEATTKVENSRNIYEEAIEGVIEDNKKEQIQLNKSNILELNKPSSKSQERNRKGYFDFEAMSNDLIEQRFNEISPFPIMNKGISSVTNRLNDEAQSAVESLEELLHAAWDKEQQEIKDIIYDITIENMQQEYAESQSPIQYNFEPDYEDIEKQAQEVRQYYEDQISNDFEIKVETKLDLKEDETGQLSLFDNILPEKNWGQEIETQTNNISETAIKGQISFQQLQEAIENSERAFAKLTSSKNTNGKSFIQNTDLPATFLKTYEGISKGNDKGYKATTNLRELKSLGDELADVKTKLKVSFDEAGNLKSSADPLEVQSLLNKYDELVNKIQNLKAIIQSPSSQESFLLEEFKQITKAEKEAFDEAENFKNKTQEALNKTLTDKNFASGKDTDITTLDSYFKVGSSDNLDKVRSTVAELKILKEQLKASRADDGSLIGEPKDVSALIERYNTLSKTLQSLIVQIKLPNSSETIGLKIAKDAEKAEKELDELKAKVDTVIGKSSLFETQTLKTINAYGTFNGEEGKRTDLITPDKLGEKYGDRFAKQQEQVQQLISKFREYKTAVEELETLRTSDNTTLEQLTEANDKVKNLKDNITTLSQTIKTSGIANASEEQLGALKNRLEIFLEKNPNLTLGIRQQIQEYIDILNSGASVSKTRYASMTADLNKFAAAQTSGRTIWEQMVGKMREGIAFLATKFSFYEIFNQFRQGFEVIHQFDDALTEMMKVSDETRLSLERYQKTTFDTADAIGTNALQIQNSTADFMRLGETLNEAAESAKSANVLMNVSEFQSIDEATKSLIAMSAAYDDLSKMNIIDKLNEVGNNFSISTSEAAEALQSSASALQTAGNSMDESLALITAGNAVVQDANKVGTGMRTIALRLTGKAMCPNIE